MSRSVLSRLVAAALACVLVASACGGDDDVDAGADAGVDAADEGDTLGSAGDGPGSADGADSDPADGPVAETPTPIELDGTCTPAGNDGDVDAADLTVKPPVEVPETAPDELVTVDIVEGGGAAAAADDYVVMEYVGVACSTGEQFDASWDRESPFPFVLGAGSVIAGWDQGIEGMKVGGRRTLVIPPDLGYGDTGSGSGSILPGETLVFVVDLVGLIPADATVPEPTVPDDPADELATEDLEVGTGAEAVVGSQVLVHYRGFGQLSGEQFDASIDRGIDQPFAFVLGAGQVIAGWDQGIEGMKVGGVREIVIPAALAYGDQGAGDGVIAPGETLVFTVELFAVL